MTRILRAVLKDAAIHVYVYSPDDLLNARIGKEVAQILGPEAATIFWRLRELGELLAPEDDELNLVQVMVDDRGRIAVDACASLSESTVSDVLETGMQVLVGDEVVAQLGGGSRPVSPLIH